NLCQITKSFTLAVACPVPVIAPASLPNAVQYSSYSQTITSSGGTSPYAYTITAGSLPAGLTLSTSGSLTGTPTAVPGTFNFTVRTTDTNGCPATKDYTLVLDCPTITVSPTTLSVPTVSFAYSTTLSASGGTAPYAWSITSGSMPPGLSFDTGTG